MIKFKKKYPAISGDLFMTTKMLLKISMFSRILQQKVPRGISLLPRKLTSHRSNLFYPTNVKD